jgi:hypothetical protein
LRIGAAEGERVGVAGEDKVLRFATDGEVDGEGRREECVVRVVGRGFGVLLEDVDVDEAGWGEGVVPDWARSSKGRCWKRVDI